MFKFFSEVLATVLRTKEERSEQEELFKGLLKALVPIDEKNDADSIELWMHLQQTNEN